MSDTSGRRRPGRAATAPLGTVLTVTAMTAMTAVTPMTAMAIAEPAGRAGYPTGERAGCPSGERAGCPTGERAGFPTGERAGCPTGERAGCPTGERAGCPSGERAGESSWHGRISAGGFAAATGPAASGFVAEAVLYPGTPYRRLGLALSFRRLGDGAGMVTAGWAYEGGASRPRLTLALHGELGYAYGPGHPIIGGGVRAQLGVWGPFVVATDGTGHLFVDGIDSRLALTVAVTVGVAR